jgi:hypothetical protein
MFAQAELLDEVDACVDRVNDTDLLDADPTAVKAAVLDLQRLKSKLAALEAKLCRRFETDGEWAKVGALTPGAFVAAECRVPSSSLRRSFALGRQLTELPGLQLAMEAGAVQLQHRDKLLAVDGPRVHERFVADHVEMVRWAIALPWDEFCDRLAQWLAEADPDGPDPGYERRRFALDEGYDGTFTPAGCVDAIGGQIAKGELRRLERILFEEDWAEAKERLGCEPLVGDLRRSHAQRSADAFVLMAERSATLPEDGRRGTHLVNVVAGPDAFATACRLASGQPILPRQLARYLDDRAVVQTIVYDQRFHPVKASTQRLFVGLLRIAIKAKHRRCFHAYCDTPVDECEIDHRIASSRGGATSDENGQPGCAPHNRRKGNHIDPWLPDDFTDP